MINSLYRKLGKRKGDCFYYKAVDLNGKIFKGQYLCENKPKLALKLRESGLYLVKAQKKNIIKLEFLNSRVNLKDIAVFCRQLYSVHNSGIMISEALRIMQEQCSKNVLKESLMGIKENVIKGESLFNSMRHYNKIYPSFLLNMICIGEEGGNLDLVLNQLSDYYENEHKTLQKLKTSLTYPLVLFVLTVVITIFLMMKVVPIFAGNLTSMGVELPMITVVILWIISFVTRNFIQMAIIIILGVLSLLKFLETSKGKNTIDRFKLRLPIYKNICIKVIETRFVKIMFILLSSGINIIKALELVKNSVNNKVFDDIIFNIIKDIKEGVTVTDSIKNTRFFSGFLIAMVSVGEESGSLEQMLEKCGVFMENDLNEFMDRAMTLLQPLLMVILAGVIGTVILSIMLPMFKLMDSMGA